MESNELSSYRDFIVRNQQYAKPISWEELQNQIEQAGIYLAEIYPDLNPSGKTTSDLKAKLIKELNIGFLLKRLDWVVTIVAEHPYPDYIEKELLLTNSEIGTFSVLLLVPEKEHRCAIIGLHGHRYDNTGFRDRYGVKEWPKQGFTVAMPTFRAMGCDATEEIITTELALKGFTLMGLRIYETLVLIEYLKRQPIIDRIGIMGHSGGSDVAYLTSIINQDIKALAFDMYPKLSNLCEGRIHCETIPSLAGYDKQINEWKFEIPFRKWEYKYPNAKEEILEFFNKNLKIN